MQSQLARQLPDSNVSVGEGDVIWEPQPGSQEFFLSCPIYEVLYDGTRGPGKALPIDEVVMTPFGSKTMGNMKLGSYVCCPDGTTSKVIGVYPQGKEKIYKLVFEDGVEVRATAEHIWAYSVVANSLRADMGDNFRLGLTKKLRGHIQAGRHVLTPVTSPVSFRYPVNKSVRANMFGSYLFGALLGDGSFRNKSRLGFSTGDKELSDLLQAYGAIHDKAYDWYISKGRDKFGLIPKVKSFGLWGKYSHEKFIPKPYLYAPVERRLALLQGLMDTDGSVDKNGYVEYSSSSRQLAKDVQFLVQSLGGRATINTHKTTHLPSHRLYIQIPEKHKIFRLKRKKERCQDYMHNTLWRRIVSIEEDGYEEAQCIKIDHPRGLFLTNGFVVTHNTDALIMDYAQHVGIGYGEAWRGILFRNTYKQLSDIVARSKKWFFQIFPGSKFNESDYIWKFPTGEQLLFRYMDNPDDYWNYHGHEYPWIGWEELTNWKDNQCYDSMHACCRSTKPGMPRKYRSTSNPFGKGHGWVKRHMVDIGPPGTVATDDEGNKRVRIHGVITENKILLEIDPEYIQRIMSTKDPNKRKAWVEGSWDIVAGGAIDDVWEEDIHMIQPFDLPPHWKYDRSFDWGASAPFSVGWWAESDGSDVVLRNGRVKSYPPKTVFRIAEWYGWNGNVNEGCRMSAPNIAKKIKEIESHFNFTVQPGPADSSIYDAGTGLSIADEMGQQGIRWVKANKGPGSRVTGLEVLRARLEASCEVPMEEAGIFIFDTCTHWKRTVPVLPRDTKKLEDVDTDAEDHCFSKDTKVITDSGKYRIKDLVGKSGYILSVGGHYSRFYNCRKTRDSRVINIVFDDNSEIVCTPEHKFLTTRGWIEGKNLDNVDETGYRLLSFKNGGTELGESKLLVLLFKSLMEDVFICAINTFSAKEIDYIKWFGNFIKELLQKESTYTIKNLIEAKIRLKIYNYLQSQNINHFMQSCKTIQSGMGLCEEELLNGMEAKPELHGIKSNTKNTVKEKLMLEVQRNVRFVPHNMKDFLFKGFVAISAKRLIAELPEQILWKSFAFGAESCISPRNIIAQVLVQEAVEKGLVYQKRVKRIERLERTESVYCMDVEHSRSFILENGIAVSNCYDETRYRLTARVSSVTQVTINIHG